MFKLLSLSALALTATTSFASAESYFQNFKLLHETAGHIEVGLVRAESDGVVEIYQYHGGEVGALMGTAPVHAGANTHVHIDTLRPAVAEAIALLRINGEVVDTQEIDFN